MCPYTKVSGINDKKEGHFLLDKPLDDIFRARLKREKKTYMIGCASNKLYNQYMWSRFAQDGMGLCIAFTCNDSTVSINKVKYVDGLPVSVKNVFEGLSLNEQVQFALLHKRKRSRKEEYEKEEEIRFMKKVNDNQNDAFMDVNISAVYLGRNMPKEEMRCWRCIAQNYSFKVSKLRNRI